MSRTVHSILSVAIALTIAAVLIVVGVATGPALITGAVGGIVASILMQRRLVTDSTGDDETFDEDDLQVLHQTAAALVRELRGSVAQIEDPNVQELAERIGDEFAAISTQISNTQQADVAPVVFDDLFEPAQALVTDYLWLQRREGIAERDLMTKIATRDLPAAEVSARQVQSLLAEPGEIDTRKIKNVIGFPLEADDSGASTNPETWGNRQRLIDEAEAAKRSN